MYIYIIMRPRPQKMNIRAELSKLISVDSLSTSVKRVTE